MNDAPGVVREVHLPVRARPLLHEIELIVLKLRNGREEQLNVLVLQLPHLLDHVLQHLLDLAELVELGLEDGLGLQLLDLDVRRDRLTRAEHDHLLRDLEDGVDVAWDLEANELLHSDGGEEHRVDVHLVHVLCLRRVVPELLRNVLLVERRDLVDVLWDSSAVARP